MPKKIHPAGPSPTPTSPPSTLPSISTSGPTTGTVIHLTEEAEVMDLVEEDMDTPDTQDTQYTHTQDSQDPRSPLLLNKSHYGRLIKDKNGDGAKRLTERKKWIIATFSFLKPHIRRQCTPRSMGLHRKTWMIRRAAESTSPPTTCPPAGYQGHPVIYQEGALTNPAAYQPWVRPGPSSTHRPPFLVPPSSTPCPSSNHSTLDLSQFTTHSFFEMMGSEGQSQARPPPVSSVPPTEPPSDTLETACKNQEKHQEPLLPPK
ncbi:hypothetical protein Pcinc_017554 [Petrolisthes cinctipes]|uniref:Uncharacterized protein n=1 Tax=Petrolisthes cinctipes TaxID=88211 RepID=A0AAE1KKF0_PETCI|nr:hypothetical protein Pcinc_017554 [Petrolisthes cinctipes]